MKAIYALSITAAIVLVAAVVEWLFDALRPKTGLLCRVLVILAVCGMIGLAVVGLAHGRDLDGRYAASPLKDWFDNLRSGKGPCCSDADGSAVSDADWETKDGKYRVRLEGEWWDVPDDAVITEPNLAGRTMVWPVIYRGLGAPVRIEIRCFIPGSMT